MLRKIRKILLTFSNIFLIKYIEEKINRDAAAAVSKPFENSIM